MHINEILSESSLQPAMLTFRDLNSMQAAVLVRLLKHGDRVSYDTVSPREQAVMDSLAELGLLDEYTHELTDQGARIAQIAIAYQKKKGSAGAPEQRRKYSDVGDRGEDLGSDIASEVPGVRMNRWDGVKDVD